MLETERICLNCGNVVTIVAPVLHREAMYTEDGEEVTVMYYICPQCKKKNVVQVDNSQTLMLVDRMKKILLKAIGNNQAGKTNSRGQQKKYKSLNVDLMKERGKLETLLQGRSLYGSEGNVVIERFEMCKGSDIVEGKMQRL